MAVNDDIADLQVRHMVGLQRYSTSVVRKIIALLNRVEPDLIAQILKRDPTAVSGEFSQRRLEALLEAIREINAAAYREVQRDLRDELGQLAVYETSFQQRLVGGAITVELDVVTPSAQQLKAAVLARPLQGRLLKEWAQGLEQQAYVRVRDAIRMGFVQGETIDQMVRRIRGTKAASFADGVLEISRRAAERVVRTAVNHTANYARELFYAENDDLIKGVMWVATLDTRTCTECMALDKQEFDVDEGPRPPLHLNCRCTTTPITKSWKELGINLPEAPEGTRASMNGQVPASLSYNEWLKNQTAAVQDEALGPTRGALFRKGGLPVDRFVNRNGDQITLDELEEQEAAAFRKAGLAA
jgi:SPP1 gp7 family putative phage head morphogenesis protein